MNEYVTIKEIAQAKGLKSTRSIRMEINKPESKYISREVKVNGGISYEILFSSLEPELQQKLRECETKSTAIVPLNYKPPIITDKARQTANHRMNIVKAALEHRNKYPSIKEADAEFLDLYNSGLYLPKAYEFLGRISIGTLRRYIQAYKKTGNAESLIPQYKITKQGEYAMRKYGISRYEFPCHATFKRRLEREVPEQSIYLARYGESAWNRKYGNYIDRDYSTVICGEAWVSDHAQIDVACLNSDGSVVFPWVTAWRDYKSGKWLGWILQCGHPNSDHIFQSFYYAVEKYGLPKDVIIDNGKDYRSKDFAGGRKFKIEADEFKTTCMLEELNVKANFALPYNAQTKPIERDFLKIKELLSKHCVGYRGGNVVERPEKLAKEIKAGKIIPFDVFKEVFDDFVINVLNKRPSRGKNHEGLSPDQLFNQECAEVIKVESDALKLFCTRTSKNYTIRRNGIKDNELGITYWADWMISKTGLKVYLRRDIQNFKVAWVFRADNNAFIGKVTAVKAVAALHADEISKEAFKDAMAIKKRSLKIAKSYIKQTREISLEEKCANYKAAYASVEKEIKPKVSRIANTNMDKVIRKSKEMDAFGRQDLSMLLDENKPQEKPLYLYETDKILEQELKGVANGY